MENLELLMEKYKNEMLQLASRAIKQVYDENIVYVTEKENTADTDFNTASDERSGEEQHPEDIAGEIPPVYSQGQGSVKIKVFTGNEAFPIMSALVRVLDGESLLFQEFTDQSGMVSEVYLPAPSRTISESPGNEKGYATYKIVVSHPRFNTVVMENVPVFDGVESIQPVAMEPVNNVGIGTITETEPFMPEEGYNA